MISIFFKTYGCQANVADSESLALYLEGLGCSLVQEESLADLLFINTCAVRDKAEQKMFSYIGELQEHKKERPYIKIGVIGCVASYRKQEIYERYDHVDFVFGAKEDARFFQTYLADLIVQLETVKQFFILEGRVLPSQRGQDRDIIAVVKEKGLAVSDHTIFDGGAVAHPATSSSHEIKRSYINIMTGCNEYCTYCIVGFTRGKEVYYDFEALVLRVHNDVERGAKEVTLIGQNVNSYKDPQTGRGFADLLEAVVQVPGNFWIRFVSPHPKYMTKEVFEVMGTYKQKVCGWLHHPLQAGSNRILELMKRPYTVEHYIAQVAQYREICPEGTLSTDIIVGFPGETEEEFLQTMNAIEKIKYHNIFSFIYSKRKYTRASTMADTLTYQEKQKRLALLQARQKEISLERNQEYIGKKITVLVEQKTSDGYMGRTAGNIRVQLSSPFYQVGEFAEVSIMGATPAMLLEKTDTVDTYAEKNVAT